MQNSNFPPGSMPSVNEINDRFQGMMESTGDFINDMMKMQDSHKLIPGINSLSPDTFGCERLFIEFFINDRMEEDFPLIARDFYAHEFVNIPEYEDVEYLDSDSGEEWPERMFNRFTLNLMLNAVNSGSEYTKELFLYLHKTYYKKEYKTLKRFSKISYSELLALGDTGDDNFFYCANLSRIICISKMRGIKIGEDCNYVYAFLNDFSDKLDLQDRFSFDEATGDSFKDCQKEIEERFDKKKIYSLDAKMSKFLGNVLKWLGYSPEFADCCDENDRGVENRLAITLSILKKTFPKSNKEYSAEELTLYGMILHCASAMTCNSDWMADMLRILAYGEDGTYYYDEFPPMFHPEDMKVTVSKPGNVKTEKQIKKQAEPAVAEVSIHDENALLEEIDKLRCKVRKLESDNSNLRANLSEKRRIEEESKDISNQLEASNRELAVLRNYVYNLTENDNPVTDKSIKNMKETIAGYRIVIIGGHLKWVSKMKKEFPDWVFVSPDAGGSTDVSIVDKADYVYFFTDTISHSKYYQFMNVIRERKINFGYIHGVNIENNIRDIYRDIEED